MVIHASCVEVMHADEARYQHFEISSGSISSMSEILQLLSALDAPTEASATEHATETPATRNPAAL